MSAVDDSSSRALAVRSALREQEVPLYRFVQTRVPADEAEDVFQLAALRAIERAHTLRDTARALPWLYRVFRNVVTDETRKRASRGRWLDTTESLPEPPMSIAHSICQCSLHLAQQLSAAQASVLELVDAGDATLKEAAEALGVSVNNATVRLHRARKALRRRLVEHCGVTTLRDSADCPCASDRCYAVTQ